jgi:hypothetical protein
MKKTRSRKSRDTVPLKVTRFYDVCRVQANYMMWRYAKGLLSYLDKRAKAIQLDYERVLTGKKTESPRSTKSKISVL